MTAAASSAVALGLSSTGDGGGGGHCDRHHALYPLGALPAGTSPGPACTAWCTLYRARVDATLSHSATADGRRARDHPGISQKGDQAFVMLAEKQRAHALEPVLGTNVFPTGSL